MSKQKEENKSAMAIGGGVLIGLGVGFFLLELSPLFFMGSILTGLGLGLVISSLIVNSQKL